MPYSVLAQKLYCMESSSALQQIISKFQSNGDIGLVAEANRCNQKLIFAPKKLSVNAEIKKFKEIAAISGNLSQSKKCDLTV